MADKIRQAIDELELEVSDPEKFFMEPDLKERLANKIAGFLAKGVGNPSVVYDMVKKAHDEGKFPASTPQGRGSNLREYTDRIMAMFSVSSGTLKLHQEAGKKLLVVNQPIPTDKQVAQQYETPEPIIPKSSERPRETEEIVTASGSTDVDPFLDGITRG